MAVPEVVLMSFVVDRGTISSLDSPSHLSLIALSSGGKLAHLHRNLEQTIASVAQEYRMDVNASVTNILQHRAFEP